jgi:Uma2 family endonuclease
MSASIGLKKYASFAAVAKQILGRARHPFDPAASANCERLTMPPREAYRLFMTTLTIELPSHAEQTERNLRLWAELVADPELAKFEGRIETDRHGHIIMSPPPAASHGSFQSKITHLLWSLVKDGRVITECPISTSDGVKAADVAWASPSRIRELGNRVCFPHAPEICVEVLSPSNTREEIREKQALYFDAGAQEVWICSGSGAMTFFVSHSGEAQKKSRLCPKFPRQIDLE